VEVTQEGAKVNTVYNPEVASSLNSGIDPTAPFAPRFHPNMPVQGPLALWTFTARCRPSWSWAATASRFSSAITTDSRPPKKERGLRIHTISTHEHNGHHGAENDGFTGAFFFPGQFYDYHWPVCHAGYYGINPDATDPRCGGPADSGDIYKCPGTGTRP